MRYNSEERNDGAYPEPHEHQRIGTFQPYKGLIFIQNGVNLSDIGAEDFSGFQHESKVRRIPEALGSIGILCQRTWGVIQLDSSPRNSYC